MKLIFINSFFYPDHSATSQLLSELAFALAESGDDVTVICSRNNYTDPGIAYPRRETIRGVKIHRVATPACRRNHLAGRMLHALSFYIGASLRLLRLADRGTLVIAKTDPPLIGLASSYVCRLRHARQINWLQDLFPETAIALKMRPFAGWLGRRVLAWRNRTLRSACMNVVIASRMQRMLAAESIDEAKLRTIPNWANGKAITPVPASDNPLRQQWGLADAFVVTYSGNLGRAHEFDTLLSAATELRNDPAIRFLFIGGGVLMERLRNAVEERGLENCCFKPYQPMDQLHLSLSVADVHIVSLRPELRDAVSPSKYYGIAAAGRACIYIGDADDEIPQHLLRTHSGFSAEPGDSATLAAQIRTLSHNRAHIEMGDNARQAFEASFDFPLALRRWRTVLQESAPPIR